MLFYIIKWALIYLILIFLAHQIYLFFEKNLTTTKIKDFYNIPSIEYKKINDIISNTTINNSSNNNSSNNNIQKDEYNVKSSNMYSDIFNNSYNNNIQIETNNFDINNEMNNKMKNELQDFLNNIK